jgi:RNA polymerase sigma factor (sigma-70 family)
MDLNERRELGASRAMYGTALKTEPSASELEAARLGFNQMLRRKRFSGRFIETNAEDLLARARFEYTRALSQGAEIHSPAGWLINCAWRRTQNLLEAQGSEPAFVSTEKAGAIVDEQSPSPEEAAIEGDRARRIEAAMAELSHDQRMLIELSYFEGMSVREAGRFLRWHSSKAQRTHEAGLRALREALGVSDIDELAIEIGLAAWVSLAAEKGIGVRVPAGVEAAADSLERGAGGLWARAHEAARRVLAGGGEPSSAMAAGGAARTAGVCGVAAVACLAGGVVGPGVGGVGLVGVKHREARVIEQPSPLAEAPSAPVGETRAPEAETETEAVAPEGGEQAAGVGVGTSEAPSVALPEPSSEPSSPTGEAEAEFSPFEGEGEGTGSATSAPAKGQGESAAPPRSPSAGEVSAEKEFGSF